MSLLQQIFEEGRKAENKKKAKSMTFSNEGKFLNAKMVVYDDAFFEIVGGKYDGNLVHRWDIVKPKN